MKIDTQVNGQKVTIELTNEQLDAIRNQTSNRLPFKEITSLEIACEVTGENYNELMTICRSLSKDEAAFKQLKVIIQAINPIGYSPNWEDNEYKYWNYFNMRGGFSFYVVSYGDTGTSVPSALCFPDEERAKYAAKTFLDYYKNIYITLIINKNIMSNYQTISRKDLKAIYDVACNPWKVKLEDYAKRTPFENSVAFSQDEINEMFKASDSKQINVLKQFFNYPVDIKDKVKSFEDACKICKINPEFNVFSQNDTTNDVAFKKLKIIIRALNEGWFPNWNNTNEYKYYPWFKMEDGFSFCNVNYNGTNTDVSSALYLKTEELARHAAKIAFEEYKAYYM